MKILLINKSLYPKGGDAISTRNTGILLSSKKHRVTLWGMEHPLNPEYPHKDSFVSYIDYHNPKGMKEKVRLATSMLYSFEAKRNVERLIRSERPDIVHLNNFAHQISPSILHVFKKHRIPVVMTMHDYKLVCPTYSMTLRGKPCERCKNGRFYQCFINKCTKNSFRKSLLNTTEMYLHHNVMRIYDLIDVYISPSKFLKSKCEEMGFRREIVYLPNFVTPEEYEPQYNSQERSIVYFGRLSEEKGLSTLIDAVKDIPEITLKIIGEGPLRSSLELRVESLGLKNIKFLGYKTGDELKEEIRKAMFVLNPSEWYENNPLSVIEAFALGKSAVGARIGGIPELIRDNETGLTFESGNAEDLRSKVQYLLNNPDIVTEMGRNARSFVEQELNAEKYYECLIEIYQKLVTGKDTTSVSRDDKPLNKINKTSLKVFLINKSLYPKGGDAISTTMTGSLLSLKGHYVVYWGMNHLLNPKYSYKSYFVPFVDYNNPGSLRMQTKMAMNMLYSFEAKREIKRLLKIEMPDIIHLNNFAHQISPSILHGFKKHRIPVVMTMRDYKLICPVYTMVSHGKPCERCKNGRYYHCLINKCTKDSFHKSMLNTMEMYLHHDIMRIYDLIDVYISPSKFLKSKCEEMGFRAKIVYLPNFVSPEEYEPQYHSQEKSIVYFGRLSEEKGLSTLIDAVKDIPEITLKIIGEGPEKEGLELEVESLKLKNVRFLGYKTGRELKDEVRKSMFVVIPSEWYENNPRSVIEGFALGKPAIGARIGGIPELVRDNETGLTFESGNAEDLRSKIQYLGSNPDMIVGMGKNARRFVEEELNAEKHYIKLVDIYQRTIEGYKN